jgi:hypothetical protein
MATPVVDRDFDAELRGLNERKGAIDREGILYHGFQSRVEPVEL